MKEGTLNVLAGDEPRTIIRFNGGEFIDEPLCAFVGNLLKLDLGSFHCIVSNRDPEYMQCAGMPDHP